MAVNPALASTAAVQGALTLRQIFATVDAESCPSSYNFHMHTVCSDGQLEPEALVEQAISIGLVEYAITDHHSVKGYRRAKAWLEDWQWRHPSPMKGKASRQSAIPRLWSGVEITATLLETEVHILGYAFNIDHPAIKPYLQGHSRLDSDRTAQRVVHAIQQANGLAVLAHPARYRRPAEELIQAVAQMGIDGAEAYYAYDNPSIWRPSPDKTETVEYLAQSHGLLRTCGTDTHGKSLLRRI
ncbi:MAG: PHP domain-containing protein [Leptolyngbyaceae cyanobacterium SM1_1_3]|nr:PHP domain-containing protein [Leptolyngbyaceae cyanobacterium SM1_1_3]NJN04550.1 PHP domain-containing protein [Leptolyngbyaceae cyanobacterium RM1_1_2]NJO10959.1 PHP domain-containing protein [Leptolyngbyaceae cyanobacterium SL_1_1]